VRLKVGPVSLPVRDSFSSHCADLSQVEGRPNDALESGFEPRRGVRKIDL